MILIDLLFAFLLAFFVAALFGGRGVRRAGVWPIFLFFFLLLLPLTWAGGIWLTPFGPTLWGGYWLPFVATAIIAALVFATLLPPARSPRPPGDSDRVEGDAGSLAIGIFFWVILALLIAAIFSQYAY